MGWLKVMLTKGAIPTSPSGCTRSTARGPGSTSGASMSVPAGNGRSTVSPVRGGGSVSGGRLKSTVSLPSSSSHGGSRSVTARISAASSGLPSTRLTAGALVPPIASPSLRRTVNAVPRAEPPESRAEVAATSVGALPLPPPSPPEADVAALPDAPASPPEADVAAPPDVEAAPDVSPGPASGSPSPTQALASSTTTIPTIRQRLSCAGMDRQPFLAQSQGYDDAKHRSVPTTMKSLTIRTFTSRLGPVREGASAAPSCFVHH